MGKKVFTLWVIYGIAIGGVMAAVALLLETSRGLVGSLASYESLDALAFPMVLFIIALTVMIFTMAEIVTDKSNP